MIRELPTKASNIPDNLIIAILIMSLVILILLGIALLYLISSLRRKSVVLKKADYLIEDITYKSESLNVTVETINRLSNYALTLDAASNKGIKTLIKFLSENRNYIYAIVEKLRNDVENKEKSSKNMQKSKTKKTTTKKPSNTKNTKSTTNKLNSNKK